MNMKRQVEAYRQVMGRERTEKQLAAVGRCTSCGGTLPAGHYSGCPYWGGREPLPK